VSASRVPASTLPTILLVEDDADLAAMLADYLMQHGYTVEIESRGDRAVERICRMQPALAVLDLVLPGIDGLTICRTVRPGYGGPILMLTARSADNDEVTGLETGADDYLAKPVAPRVLLARVRALLRRGRAPATRAAQRLTMHELLIERATRTVRVSGHALKLTSGEFDLLWLLASHAGEELSRAFLYEQLHSADWDDFDRSIDLRVSRLRQKLAEHSGQEFIKTVRGVGYLFVKS